MWTHCKNNHISIVDSDISTHVCQLPVYFDVDESAWGRSIPAAKAVKPMKTQLRVQNVCPSSHFPKWASLESLFGRS